MNRWDFVEEYGQQMYSSSVVYVVQEYAESTWYSGYVIDIVLVFFKCLKGCCRVTRDSIDMREVSSTLVQTMVL